MASLAEGMRDELRRCRALLEQYRAQPDAAGAFAAAMLAQDIAAAEDAQATGDVVAMVRTYQELRGYES